jgi:hypothetical protein
MEYPETARRFFSRIMVAGRMTSADDFPAWRCRFLNILKSVGLDRFLLEGVPKPEDISERARWHEDRTDVENYLRTAIPGLEVWIAIHSMGWREEEKNPKKTFDILARYFHNRGPGHNRAAVAALPAPPQINSLPLDANDAAAGATSTVSTTEFEELRARMIKMEETITAPADAVKALEEKLDLSQRTGEANHNVHLAKISEIEGLLAKIGKTAAPTDTVKALENRFELLQRTLETTAAQADTVKALKEKLDLSQRCQRTVKVDHDLLLAKVSAIERELAKIKKIAAPADVNSAPQQELNSIERTNQKKISQIEDRLRSVNVQGLAKESDWMRTELDDLEARVRSSERAQQDLKFRLDSLEDQLGLEWIEKQREPNKVMKRNRSLAEITAARKLRRKREDSLSGFIVDSATDSATDDSTDQY